MKPDHKHIRLALAQMIWLLHNVQDHRALIYEHTNKSQRNVT